MQSQPEPRALLDLEARWCRLPGAKERTIAEELGIGATRYYLLLVGIVSAPPADLAVEYATVITRVRRQLEAQARVRRAS